MARAGELIPHLIVQLKMTQLPLPIELRRHITQFLPRRARSNARIAFGDSSFGTLLQGQRYFRAFFEETDRDNDSEWMNGGYSLSTEDEVQEFEDGCCMLSQCGHVLFSVPPIQCNSFWLQIPSVEIFGSLTNLKILSDNLV